MNEEKDPKEGELVIQKEGELITSDEGEGVVVVGKIIVDDREMELEIASIERMDKIEDDAEFLDYALAHSKSKRHVFIREHALRLYRLAGIDTAIPEKKEFVTHLDYDALLPIVEKAKARMGLTIPKSN